VTDISDERRMPAFELPDQEENPWNLDEQLSRGPVMLVFYRGDW
jgi:peroxiredoxin